MKIDTTTIEGFDGMTAEQKVEALLGLDVPDKVNMSLYVSKEIADKYASEAADWKKQYNGKLTDDEAAKAKAEEDWNDLNKKYTDLVKRTTIAEHTAKYLSMPGYDEALARETAEALYNGEMDKVFANQQKASSAHEKKLRADLMKGGPKPDGAGGGDDDKPENIEMAKRLGKARSDSMKTSESVLKHYL